MTKRKSAKRPASPDEHPLLLLLDRATERLAKEPRPATPQAAAEALVVKAIEESEAITARLYQYLLYKRQKPGAFNVAIEAAENP